MNSRSLLFGKSIVVLGLYIIFVITRGGISTLLQFEYGPRLVVIQAILSFSQFFILLTSVEISGTVPHLKFSLCDASLIVAIVWSIRFSITEKFKG